MYSKGLNNNLYLYYTLVAICYIIQMASIHEIR